MNVAETPVVIQQIDNVLLVPLQGPIHEQQLSELNDAILKYLEHQHSDGVILDMTGVEVLDASDFEKLKLMMNSVALMGAQMVLVEIRPGVAAGLTMLDVDLSWSRTARTVELGMEYFK